MPARSSSPSKLRYRRARHIVSYWEDQELVLHNYATGLRAAAAPRTVALLGACGEWRGAGAIARETGFPEGEPIEAMLGVLVEAGFLERSDRSGAAARVGRGYDAWNGWNPAASFFHAATKDVPFAEPVIADATLRAKAIGDPPPPMVKRTPARGRVALPAASAVDGLSDTLRARRTWRRFGSARVSRADLATLLHLTWGVQQWMRVEGFGRMALKTSPSGGARHSIEAYACVRRVEGIRPGIYHYGPDDHQLHRVKAAGRKLSDYLPTQTWYDDAAAVVFMTAIFARAQWRYGYARAYRSILTEAGHLAQTFCLVATRLGLAPFCTMALADSVIERDLGVDGVSESVVYAVGVGTRPEGVEWAPWPDTDRVPRRTQPAWKRR